MWCGITRRWGVVDVTAVSVTLCDVAVRVFSGVTTVTVGLRGVGVLGVLDVKLIALLQGVV